MHTNLFQSAPPHGGRRLRHVEARSPERPPAARGSPRSRPRRLPLTRISVWSGARLRAPHWSGDRAVPRRRDRALYGDLEFNDPGHALRRGTGPPRHAGLFLRLPRGLRAAQRRMGGRPVRATAAPPGLRGHLRLFATRRHARREHPRRAHRRRTIAGPVRGHHPQAARTPPRSDRRPGVALALEHSVKPEPVANSDR